MKLAIITCQKLPTGVKDDQALFNALKQNGFDLEIVAWDADVEWNKFDAGLIRSVWDYHERPIEFTAWLEEVANKTHLINSAEIINWNKNKNYLAELDDFGISIAPTLWLKKHVPYNLDELFREIPAEKYFMKPVIGADSSGTLPIENNQIGINKAEKHLELWLPQVDMMIQPYISTVESFGETSLIYFGGSFSHAVRKIPVNGDYRVQDTFGAQDISYYPNAIEFSLSKACLDFLNNKFNQVSYARFDFLHDTNDAVYMNEAELIEPSLFFNHSSEASILMAKQLKRLLDSCKS